MPNEDAAGETRDPAVERYAGPEYKRLLDAARRSLERTGGDLTRTVTVKTPDDRERRAIIAVTGRYRPEGVGVLAVSLADLEHAVREATGSGLVELLEHLGPPVRNRPAERKRLADEREAALRFSANSFLTSRGWFQAWLAELAADGTLGREASAAEAEQVRQAARVLEWIERRTELGAAPAQLPELAATITGDAGALGHGTPLAELVLRGLAVRLGADRPATVEERRDLWDRAGIIVDDLASRVLVVNLAAAGAGLGEWLASAKEHGTPFYVTLQQLVALPPAVLPGQQVRVCRSPATARRAAAELGPDAPPLLCTEGQPSTAFHRLAAAVTGAGGGLSYHGDFDWPGIAVAAGLIARHGARPWRLSAADYESGLERLEAGVAREPPAVPLTGPPRPTPWDPALAASMTERGRALAEESVADLLIGDLLAAAPAPGDHDG